MPQITLKQLTQIIHGKLHGAGDLTIENLEIDSRRISLNKKSIFISIVGSRHNGHDHIKELVERGLKNFIVEYEVAELKTNPGINYIIVENTVEALQHIAIWYRQQLSMPLIAITGSNGKTVIKEWLAQSLSQFGKVSRSPKSYNSQIGVPLSIWLLSPEAQWSVIEAGISQPGEMSKLEKIISPEFGIFTNIGPAHQENFADLEEKVREKLKLFQNSKIVYYCRDHDLVHSIIQSEERTFKTQCWSFKHPNCNLYVSKLEKLGDTSRLSIKFSENTHPLSIPFTDNASIENCLHIITFLIHQGISIEQVQNSLNGLTPVAMRLEQIRGIKNSTLINDSYNSDIHSLQIALDVLTMQKQHSRHSLILSDIKQSGQDPESLYSEVTSLVKNYQIEQLIVVGKEISKSSALPLKALKFATTEELLLNLPKIDTSDQAILIKGAREFEFEQIVAALSEKKHATVLEINLDNLTSNLNAFRGLLQPITKIMVMVKALSYGSGSFEIANLLQHQKVDYLGVAFTDEGVDLRQAGISLPIMVMAPSIDSYEKIIEFELEPEIFNLQGLQKFSDCVNHNQIESYPIHIKLDTGMHRLGFMPDEIEQLSAELTKVKNIHVKALFSHLAVSDNPLEDSFTHIQLELFQQMYNTISDGLGYLPIRHILNSAGIERFPSAHFEMVRLGIGLHGVSSSSLKLKAVSTLKTTISQIKKLNREETVGYNRRGILDRDSIIAIIPIGYADGLDRKLGNGKGQVIINNCKAPFLGDICMDMSMIDITNIPASEGDEVIIFGEDNSIQQIANQIGTIPYEILTNVSSRVKRIYINE